MSMQRVTIFILIPPSLKFTELHALTLAARSYALLIAGQGLAEGSSWLYRRLGNFYHKKFFANFHC